MFKYIIIIFLLLLTPSLQAQMYWQRPVANFNRHTYNAASQNWNIEQDSNGWMSVSYTHLTLPTSDLV